MNAFKLVSPFTAQGDQPQAIAQLRRSIANGNKYQTLLGVTGSGKTFTMASVIAALDKPTLVISHNKTLAAQLYAEFKDFFPENAVEFFISYYDYYQPEAYIPQTDTYIEKDASINERINRLRLAATTALMSRRDVIIVASVSCIYNLGSPQEYRGMFVHLRRGESLVRDEFLQRLVRIRYERNDVEFFQGIFRVRGDTVEVFPAYEQNALRIEFFGDEIEKISVIEPVTLQPEQLLDEVAIYPAKHFLVEDSRMEGALAEIEAELKARVSELTRQGKLLEAQRLESRTKFDMEMLRETGICHGIENYSRHLSGRPAASRPYCLIDYFPEDFLTILDESHVTVPQIRGMYNGDRARKEVLTEYGFRLPSCLDNRPLKFAEFEKLVPQVLFVSATPSDYELKCSACVAEQIIRPTGLVDPEIIVIPTKNQIDDLIARIRERSRANERVLVTTLTKRMAEDLSRYLQDAGLKTNYIHSELDALERIKVISELRKKKFDCLVGVNLLREGLDLPEVSLVCVMDADKEGFLRSATSLIQVAGRAARNINAMVVMYADTITQSLSKTIEETSRRREKQMAYNKKYNITPVSIKKAIKDWIAVEEEADEIVAHVVADDFESYGRLQKIDALEREMELAAKNLQFEKSIVLRDKIKALKIESKDGN
ncbi:MAG: excinuclease ABC subunit UvrB [Candidatus Omnitrophica bacterium]|nr:excinuclease ABC subunit UvrB [Candidatus Omnitrophota bacterium]MBU4477685.1 excinuclease ABC subunit UvrB [Candidatus Omnitrophota bacterium]MCG2703882.1 excinuclease ABC subunit UvrB [Candidatus Omnitrophota bacterium]